MCRDHLDVPGWLKPHVRLTKPSPIILDSEGIGGVFDHGKFSDTAPKELRGRRLYTALMHVLLKYSESDPPSRSGAYALKYAALTTFAGPESSEVNWSDCTDAYETCSVWLARTVTYKCGYSASYAPYFFVLSSTPSSSTDLNAVAAYAKPCPVASSAPDISGKSRMGDLKLRAAGCDDSTNKLIYSRYVALDTSTSSYTIAGGAIARASSSTSIDMLMYYMLPSSTSKGSGDVFQFIYQVAVSYQ